MDKQHLQRMAEGRARAKADRAARPKTIKNDRPTFRLVRAHCLECSGGEAKSVTYCAVTSCTWWTMRFGCSPAAFADTYGPELVSKTAIPPDLNEDNAPAAYAKATEFLRSIASSKS